MTYFYDAELGSLFGLEASRPTIIASARTRIPEGSIVPTLRKRQPTVLQRPTQKDIVLVEKTRTAVQSNTTAFLQAGSKTVTSVASKLSGLYGLGDMSTSDMSDLTRSLVDALRQANAEASDLLNSSDQISLGSGLIAARAGELSSSLGFDVTFRDLVNSCSGEFGRVRGIVGGASDAVMATTNFLRTAAVFKDQQLSVQSLVDLAGSLDSVYGGITSSLDRIVGDSAAFGEGGLRNLIESSITNAASAVGGRWLTGDNLRVIGTLANAWVGSSASGSSSGYVSATGGTLSTLGTIIPVPAGTVVSAVGGIISSLATLFGDTSRITPPEKSACTGNNPSPTFFNPQAWTALAIAYYAKNPGILQEAQTARRTIAEHLLINYGWYATIDEWTGEVVVRPPRSGGASINDPLRRLIDVFDRNTFFPEDDIYRIVNTVQSMRPFFGISSGYPRTTTDTAKGNFLWCYPDPSETFTRAVGAVASEGNLCAPLRAPNTPDLIDWNTIADDANFLSTYAFAAVLSAYFGTVPYGLVSKHPLIDGMRRAVATGVGGFSSARTSFRVIQASGCVPHSSAAYPGKEQDWYAPCMDSAGKRKDAYSIIEPTPYDSRGLEAYPLAEFLRRMQDPSWRLDMRVPMPSPLPQTNASDAVNRPLPIFQGRQLYRIPANLIIDRSNLEKAASRGSGIPLWLLIVLGLAAGGGLLWYSQRR